MSVWQKRFIIYFFTLTLVIGALGYTPWVLASYGLLQWPVGLSIIFTIIGGGSPTFAALIVTRLQHGKRGPEYLFRQFRLRHVPLLWFLVPILLPITIAACSIALWLPFGDAYALDLSELANFLPMLASNFAINMWEEVGWRGYALPTLQKKCSALIASLILGIFWALWHWPFFAVKDSTMAVGYHNSYLFFVGVTILNSILYTWLYNSSGGNLITVSLYHGAVNTANYILFLKAGVAYDVSISYLVITAILALVLVIAFRPRFLSRRGKATFPESIEQLHKSRLTEKERM